MDISRIVLDIVAGIGGVGVIFTAAVAFSSKFIAEKLQKKYQLTLDEKLEKYKSGLDNKVYISKTRFDAEFMIYRNLSKTFTECVKTTSVLFPSGLVHSPADEKEKERLDKEKYENAHNAYVKAQDELNGSTPFIPKDFCDDYEELLSLCKEQLYDFEERWNIAFLNKNDNGELSKINREAYKRTKEINQKYNEINDRIREYLNKLDVLER